MVSVVGATEWDCASRSGWSALFTLATRAHMKPNMNVRTHTFVFRRYFLLYRFRLWQDGFCGRRDRASCRQRIGLVGIVRYRRRGFRSRHPSGKSGVTFLVWFHSSSEIQNASRSLMLAVRMDPIAWNIGICVDWIVGLWAPSGATWVALPRWWQIHDEPSSTFIRFLALRQLQINFCSGNS